MNTNIEQGVARASQAKLVSGPQPGVGRMLRCAVDAAGLGFALERVLVGQALDETDRSLLEAADLLVIAGLADVMRARFRGDQVRLFESDPCRGPAGSDVRDATVDLGAPGAPTGQQALQQIAVTRLLTPVEHSVGVCWDRLGFELAQTALTFGADVLWGQLARAGSLTLVEHGQQARREGVSGLVERAGRQPVWPQREDLALERR